MRNALLLSTALTLGTLHAAIAGGPVVIDDEVEVVEEKPASSGGLVIPLLLLAVIVAVASGGDGNNEQAASDIHLKEDVVRVGTNHLGLGVYRFRYRGMDGIWEGVMAQEVEVMHPGAIETLPFGYKAVKYEKLGLSLKQVS